MVSPFAVARRYEDILVRPPRESPYDFQRIFRTDSWGARRLSKQKFKLLRKVDPQIRAMLHEGERVYYVTWGVEYSILEGLLLGWVMFLMNRRAFVFTTQRVLLIQVGSRHNPLELRAQIRYPAIEKVKSSLGGNLKISFANGKSVVFASMPRRDRKFIQELTRTLAAEVGNAASPDAFAATENLCPHCYVEVAGFPHACEACRKPFKSARTAGLLSFLFPGVGDVYLGHRGFGTMEILGAGLVWLSVLLPVVVPLEGQPALSTAEFGATAAMLFGFMHGVDALFTRHIGRKGIYPAKGEFRGKVVSFPSARGRLRGP